MKLRLGMVALVVAFGAQAQTDAEKRLGAAEEMLEEIMRISDKSIPQNLLDKAECIVLVPGMKEGAFIFGGKYGRGFMSCRRDGPGWSAPAAIRVEGGSFGLQIGGTETDVAMLVMNEKGVDRLLRSKVTLGVDATAAAGPVGRTAQADTDAMLRAEILTWSRARGLFAGVSLQGATLRPDNDPNAELYGNEVQNRDIVSGKVDAPASAQGLIALLNKHSSRKSE